MRLLTARFESTHNDRRAAFTITHDELALIVSDAVVHAIRAYERSQWNAPPPAPQPTAESSPLTKFERLQQEMGLNEIEIAGDAAPWPNAAAAANQLSAEMGIDGFELADLPEHIEEPAVATPEIETALADWEEALKAFDAL